MTKKQPSNFVAAIAAEFGKDFTNFSTALGMRKEHATVANWKVKKAIPGWRDLQIMAAAEKAGLTLAAQARIKRLLDGRLKK